MKVNVTGSTGGDGALPRLFRLHYVSDFIEMELGTNEIGCIVAVNVPTMATSGNKLLESSDKPLDREVCHDFQVHCELPSVYYFSSISAERLD